MTASNSLPTAVYDSVEFFAKDDAGSILFVTGIKLVRQDAAWEIPSIVASGFFSGGALLGSNGLDGRLAADDSVILEISLTAIVPGVVVGMDARLVDESKGEWVSKEWVSKVKTRPRGGPIEFRIYFQNLGPFTAINLNFRISLPVGGTVVPDSAIVIDEKRPDGAPVTGDLMTTASIGTYGTGESAYLHFKASLPERGAGECKPPPVGQLEIRRMVYGERSGSFHSELLRFVECMETGSSDVTVTFPTRLGVCLVGVGQACRSLSS
ncbi:hypothetical protein [Nocardia fluminea]|uniref:hypothetical protein n=1 Tax=Nocardia fluminea TaxID=134984 RepID=UPI003D09770A